MNREYAEEKRDSHEKLVRVVLTILACGLAVGLYYHYVVQTAFVEIGLQVEKPAEFKIYWASPGGLYSEDKMAVVQVIPGQEEYGFLLTNLGRVGRLRVDPHNYEGRSLLKRFTISQPGYRTIGLEGGEALKALVPAAQVREVQYLDTGMEVSSTGNDPNFEFVPAIVSEPLDLVWLGVRLLLVALLVIPVAWSCDKLVRQYRFVVLMLFGAFILILVMAATSKRNVHPDEYVHLAAAQYYKTSFLPPRVDDPGIRDTYSVYGVSRLNNGEIYYLFAGRFDKLLDGFHLDEPLGLRMFNVFLFGLIIWYTISHIPSRPVALVLLVSPQIWYVFSYCDSDAFALFLCFILASQLVDNRSLLHRYLHGETRGARILGLPLLGGLLGLCFLIKENYLVFTGFLVLCLACRIVFTPEYFWERREAIVRGVLLLFAALAVLGSKYAVDYHVNGPDKREKIHEMRELLARKEYKPSTPVAERHVYLNMRDRGVTLKEIVTVDRWFEKTFHSAFGVYGYFTISGSSIYYDLVRWSGTVVLGYLLFSLFLRGGWIGWTVTLSGLAAAGALIGASVYHSWVMDFQPQGRYLFPLVPVFGVLCGWFVRCFRQRVLFIGCTVMYCLALYSFIFDALMKTPRIGW